MLAAPAGAQSAARGAAPRARSAETRHVAGHVLRPEGKDLRPVPDHWVTIHRVGPDTGQPIDSVRTDAKGRYAFTYRPWGSERAIYFVSSSYDGIAYFTPPLQGSDVTGDAADITVFDTTSRPVTITTRGRHLVVSQLRPGKMRDIVEVYELSNDTSVTRVARDDSDPVWSAILPADARDFKLGESDFAADAVTAKNGRVLLYAPLAPGLKQISWTYQLPASDFPLSVVVSHPAQILEVLIEDPAGSATGGHLTRVDPVSAEGRSFVRFLAQDVPANAVVRVDIPGPPGKSWTLYIAIVLTAVGAAMLAVLARAFARRGARPVAAGGAYYPATDDPDRLAREIAELDAAFEAVRDPTPAARAAWEERRAELKARLAAALARRSGRR